MLGYLCVFFLTSTGFSSFPCPFTALHLAHVSSTRVGCVVPVTSPCRHQAVASRQFWVLLPSSQGWACLVHISQLQRVHISCSDANENKATYVLWNSAGASEKRGDQVEQFWVWWTHVCCFISQWIWKQILISLRSVSAFLCLSPSFPHSFPDCFNSHFSFTFPSILSPFLHFFSCFSNSLTTSYCYSLCKTTSIHILLISQRAEKRFAIKMETRFCFVMIYYILLWPLLCTLHW